jgi:hypothetical protein
LRQVILQLPHLPLSQVFYKPHPVIWVHDKKFVTYLGVGVGGDFIHYCFQLVKGYLSLNSSSYFSLTLSFKTISFFLYSPNSNQYYLLSWKDSCCFQKTASSSREA